MDALTNDIEASDPTGPSPILEASQSNAASVDKGEGGEGEEGEVD